MLSRAFSLELMLSTWRHTLWGTGPLSGEKIGSTWLFPPTLLLQFRFFSDSIVQPYLGAGGNYTLFYGTSSSLTLSHSWGPAAGVGIDLFFLPHWFFNFDVKYLWIDTHAKLSGDTSGKVSLDINPWLFAIGVGAKW
jgi:outer membrane protein